MYLFKYYRLYTVRLNMFSPKLIKCFTHEQYLEHWFQYSMHPILVMLFLLKLNGFI